MIQTNPYAIYVHCDGAMDYNPKNSGGVGFQIVFPDSIPLEIVEESIGRFEKANIERLELEAIIRGMNELFKIFDTKREILREINTVIVTTDRYGLNDTEKTSPFRIRNWRKNKWRNYENKPIKNSDLLEKVDKTRKKLSDNTFCKIRIEYLRRKYNKAANRLATQGKKLSIKDDSLAVKGIKMGKRKYDGDTIDYKKLKSKDELVIHVFKKEPVREQWEINAEICKGVYTGKKLNIYSDNKLEYKIHRHHYYLIRIKNVFTNHIIIFRTIKEIKIDKENSG